MFTFDNPYKDVEVRANIQFNYEKMRQTVLKMGYDKVWIVESDTIPPEDALQKLLEVDAPVVTGLYGLRHGEPVPNIKRVLGDRMLSWDELEWGKIIECAGGCMGCLLLDRSVLENHSMWTEENNYAPDGPLMEYCRTHGFKQMARLDVICGHKKPDGDIIWPDKQQGYILERATQ
jgi:hypothetical protein